MLRRLLLACAFSIVLAGTAARAQGLAALIFFQPHSAFIDDQAQAQLVRVAEDLKARGGTVEIRGFADPEGGLAFNRAMSLARAELIAHTLRELGVPGDRLRITGRGPVSAIADDQESRRVEIRIVR